MNPQSTTETYAAIRLNIAQSSYLSAGSKHPAASTADVRASTVTGKIP